MLVAARVIGGFDTPIGLVPLISLARDCQVMGPQAMSVSWRSRAGPSPSLPAASACSPPSGRPRARPDRSGRGPHRAGQQLEGERPQVAAWTCSVSALSCSAMEWISSVRSVFFCSKSA
jgi:hypothetical protein